MATLKSLHVGLIPLVDAAPLVIARELGFATQEGLSLHLHKEVSWANIRDKVNVGHIDCAHMLAPMPLAATLGIGHIQAKTIAPLTLSLNGNAITVSKALHLQMLDADQSNTLKGGRAAGQALAKVVRLRQKKGDPQISFGTVYPFSCHNYELRDWLAGAGLNPDDDVNLVILPPSLMTESLQAGQIDGFVAGEPWNSVAVERAEACILATKRELWGLAPEKVLGVRAGWADQHLDELQALIRAIVYAGQWLDQSANRVQAAEILSRSEYLNVPTDIIVRALTSALIRQPGQTPGDDRGFVIFSREGASQPSTTYAAWLLTQMARWGQLTGDIDIVGLAQTVFSSDLYATALQVDAPIPNKVDDAVRAAARFDVTNVSSYLKTVTISSDPDVLQQLAVAQPR
ncbi:MAG: CmpA/NrtA family ABC transporter substrate-binding protein [Pseudomonadota bacterium]